MPTLTIYTDPNQVGTCEVPPFVVGDSTNWTLKFHNGDTFYAPANVTMTVGHINGREVMDASFSFSFPAAFTEGGETVAATFAIDPAGGLSRSGGRAEVSTTIIGGDGVYFIQNDNPSGGVGFHFYTPFIPTSPRFYGVIKATPLVVPGSTPETSPNRRDWLVIVRPRTVASATLTAPTSPATDWVGTMDPISAHVTALLSIKRSACLDMQIFGDGRMLFQGSLAIFNKIA